jgi:hypothetical protein
VKVPTGGDGAIAKARERLLRKRRGQQIRCDSEADGYSPDGRERDNWRAHGVSSFEARIALILVSWDEERP